MKMKGNALALALAAVVLATLAAPAAYAGCGSLPQLQPRGVVKPAAFVLRSGLFADQDFDRDDTASVVGLWRVKFISEGNTELGIPNGTVIDQGFSTWHSDGTEILNSGRDPVTGSFCMGVWKQTGHRSFKLNHYALNWTGTTPNVLVGPTNIREEITVSPGKDTFEGTFSIENFDQTGVSLVRLTGVVTGVRLTPDGPSYVP
jgi:hypothetical protein